MARSTANRRSSAFTSSPWRRVGSGSGLPTESSALRAHASERAATPDTLVAHTEQGTEVSVCCDLQRSQAGPPLPRARILHEGLGSDPSPAGSAGQLDH